MFLAVDPDSTIRAAFMGAASTKDGLCRHYSAPERQLTGTTGVETYLDCFSLRREHLSSG